MSKKIINFHWLWACREYIVVAVVRELESRYKKSTLGVLWLILNPLVMILIYSTVFSGVMQTKIQSNISNSSYSIFLMAGLIPWGSISDLISRGPNMFIEKAHLLKKIRFPWVCIPIVISISNLINCSIVFSVFCIILIVLGVFPGYSTLWIFPLMVLQVFMCISLGTIIGIFNVFFRDVGQITPIAIQLLFWGTPIVYPKDILPNAIQSIVSLNPILPIITSYQNIFLGMGSPVVLDLLYPIVFSLVLYVLAAISLLKFRSKIMDEL